MVRYLFYTIGDLTYQSPLVVAPFGCDVSHTKFTDTVLVASTNLDWSVKWKTNFLICKMDFPDILCYTFFFEKKIQVFVQEKEKR